MDDLLSHAAALGLRVKFRDLGRRHGEIHSSGLIVVNSERPLQAKRITLAHEIGHRVFGHDWTTERHDRAADERAAETYAVRLLVSEDDFRRAELCVGGHPHALAKELNLTPQHVVLWKASYERERYEAYRARERHLYLA